MLDYRREIDGLRALAVLPVIFFHAGFEVVRGGFVGVDVFFVISGYLITSIILAERQAGSFTIANFYERRARRILPALFVALLACLPMAWWWLLPSDMLAFSRSLLAVTGFASNFLFWRSSGYFDSAAELKPLLHTWSLAVEEQYYLLFPVLMMLAWRLGLRWIGALLAAAGLASLAAAQLLVASRPDAAFYLLPTRGWELLIGALVALHGFGRGARRQGGLTSQLGSAAGLLLIVYAILAFDRQTPTPSLATLIPTVGAALVILFASPATLAGRVLGHRTLVGIGMVSYSAYLWHQPLIAFARHRSIEHPGPWQLGGLALASLGLAYFSWKYVETPFRNRRVVGRRQVWLLALTGTVFFAALGWIGIRTQGFEDRAGGERREFLGYFENSIPQWRYFTREGIPQAFRTQCDFYDMAKYRAGQPTRVPVAAIAPECVVRDERPRAVLVWGDSHAQQLVPGLMQALPAQWQLLQVTSSGCAARLDARPSRDDYCEQSNWFALQTVARTRPDVVLVGQDAGHDAAAMAALAQGLLAGGAQRVVFAGPSPHWSTDLPKIVVHKLWDPTPRRTLAGVDTEALKRDQALKAAFRATDRVRLVSVIDHFCNAQGCTVYLGEDRRAGLTSWDQGHLTPVASQDFARAVLVKVLTDGSE